MWKLHSCNLADGSSLPNFTCWIPPQAVFTRWVTDIWCAVSMVTERLLVNIRLRLWATWPFKYEDGWRVCVGGELFTISRKTRIEILRVASTLKYTNSSFQHFHCLFESETINPVNTHQTISVQSFHSLISAVQNRFKLLQCHLSISLLRGGRRDYTPHTPYQVVVVWWWLKSHLMSRPH